MEKRNDKIAERISREIDEGTAFGDQALRILGVHPDDIARRKQRRRVAAVVVVGLAIALALLWLA